MTHQALDRSQGATGASRLDLGQQSSGLGIYSSLGERIMTLCWDATLMRLLGLVGVTTDWDAGVGRRN